MCRLLASLLLVVMAPPVALPLSAQRPLSFDRECIRIFIEDGRVRVEGTYFFFNHTDVARSQPVLYPFPVDSLHAYPDWVAVTSSSDSLAFTRRGNSIQFFVGLSAMGESAFTVTYEQRCFEPSACYIVTTTAGWHRPLKQADFEIHVPDRFTLDSINYDLDDERVEVGERVYRFSRMDFLPERDVCLRWRRSP